MLLLLQPQQMHSDARERDLVEEPKKQKPAYVNLLRDTLPATVKLISQYKNASSPMNIGVSSS